MFRRLNSIGRIALTALGLASYSLAQGSSLPETAYELDRGDLFDGALYISNFECLVFGENWLKQQACLYYKATVSDPQTPDKTSKEICFKEFNTVSKPRDFKSEKALRVKYETTSDRRDFRGSYLEGAISAARIISNERTNKTPPQSKWYETTTVALYDCDAPLDASSDTSEPEAKAEARTPSAADQDMWKNPPLAADQTLPHGLELLPGHALITNSELSERQDANTSFTIKVPSTSAHKMWWSEQYAAQLARLGWNILTLPTPLKMANRQIGQCTEQMMLTSLDPNSHNSPMLKNSNMPEIEFSAVAFTYSKSGSCETGE
jgi:hypothetical protein